MCCQSYSYTTVEWHLVGMFTLGTGKMSVKMQILCWDKPFSSSCFLDTLPNTGSELFMHRAPSPLIILLYGKRAKNCQGFGSDYRKVKPIFRGLIMMSWVRGAPTDSVIPWDKGHLWSRLDCVDRASAKYCWGKVPLKAVAAADSICSPWWHEMMPRITIQWWMQATYFSFLEFLCRLGLYFRKWLFDCWKWVHRRAHEFIQTLLHLCLCRDKTDLNWDRLPWELGNRDKRSN